MQDKTDKLLKTKTMMKQIDFKNWNKIEDTKPNKEKKYQVLIDCDGEVKESYCTYFVTKKRFHFDMPHINWKVIFWK